MRSHPRAFRFFALFLVALSVTLSFSTATQGQEPAPDYGKLDAALLGVVSPSLLFRDECERRRRCWKRGLVSGRKVRLFPHFFKASNVRT